jgi:hypothetical protein
MVNARKVVIKRVALMAVPVLGVCALTAFAWTSPDRTVRPQPLLSGTIPYLAPQMPQPPYMPVAYMAPDPPASVYSAVRGALVAAGVDDDKIGYAADKLSAAIAADIAKQTDELRLYGKIAVGSLVPLWIIALVALFRHPRRVDWQDLSRAAQWAARDALDLRDERAANRRFEQAAERLDIPNMRRR